jgi:hypothetical protein
MSENEMIKENCDGLNDCDSSILHFSEAVNNPDCPLQEEKIKKLIRCYNKNHKGYEIGKQILERNGLMELLQDEEDINDLTKAHEWLAGELEQGRNAVYGNDRLSIYDNSNRNALIDRPSEINYKHFNDLNSVFGGRKRRTRKGGRKIKRTTRKSHNKTRGSNKKKINKYKKNTRRRGGQFTEKIKSKLGIDEWTTKSMLPEFRWKSIIPKCSGIEPSVRNNSWRRGDSAKTYYLDTYADPDGFFGPETDEKNFIFELYKINKKVATDLRLNCYLLRNYNLFWRDNKKEIIKWYKLGEKQGKRRLFKFLVKMHNKEPLSDELQKVWYTINGQPESSEPSEPSEPIARKPPTPIDPNSLLHYVQNPQQYNNQANWDRNSMGMDWKRT